jgi:endonuclease/exonuclease/phosphatase family metal-dependent hydrolase
MLRIDYILADSSFRVVNHKIEPNDYSDHYFVHAGIELKDDEDVLE